ncbi:MAG TPA: bifunctional diaminohydroxyphosphoribosylaminopyrimidine deaminase/5-amino-6-(5-phosphoribosylamino)uracil reductase RibD [Tepidisphaeraceae bacterium]|nr:bifunctional diaminohydroxyphosphoribosylaminopyrimidine deaminase/5-amino-6-(5-phosphoribosylamino)uracil reductase RibD [Tepidisphaeraceae bacterium]
MPDALDESDREFLHRAVKLAMNGRGRVEPNPMVGCILVKNDRVISRGWHALYGGPHAEVVALAGCEESPEGSTAYVTLEPCRHFNKKTPPCIPALIAAGVTRVVIGCLDPNPHVNGGGASELRAAGVDVQVADDPRCRQLLAPFIANTTLGRPYITLKWAQTADGKVAGPGGSRIRISNSSSHRVIHELRGRCDAILVGIGTAVADDPLLTTRGIDSPRPLTRIVLDSDLRLSMDSQLVRTVDRGRVEVFCSKEAAKFSGTRTVLASCGVEIHAISSDSPGRLNLQELIHRLGLQGITHLLIEPGPTLAASFLTAALWDRAWVFHSPIMISDPTAPGAAPLPSNAVLAAEVNIADDTLIEYFNPLGAYGGPFASADLAMIRS